VLGSGGDIFNVDVVDGETGDVGLNGALLTPKVIKK